MNFQVLKYSAISLHSYRVQSNRSCISEDYWLFFFGNENVRILELWETRQYCIYYIKFKYNSNAREKVGVGSLVITCSAQHRY